jgi:capsular polysaccharide biosynthesis protein
MRREWRCVVTVTRSDPGPDEVGVMDVRALMYAVRRHKAIFGVLFLLGVAAGVMFTLIRPPLLASKVLVVIPGTRYVQTQAVIAGSDPVLINANKALVPPLSLVTLRRQVSVTNVTSTVLAITATGPTAAQAQDLANAVARSYVALVRSSKSPGGKTSAQMLETATPATGATVPARAAETGGLGALAGAVLGIIVVAAIGRTDRRLRERDEIAAATGASVLASVPVARPSDAAGWAKLLQRYEPSVVHAWSLRKALRQLGLIDARSVRGTDVSVTVLSLSSDRRALALGPQLAVFAASLGIPTTLVVGPQQQSRYASALSGGCTMTATALSGQPGSLRFAARDDDDAFDWDPVPTRGDYPPPPPALAALTVVIEVADSHDPRPKHAAGATATLLGVSAGGTTAEQVARLAVSVASDGRDIAGVLVADPFVSDRTTGSLPHVDRAHRRRAAMTPKHARLDGTRAEIRR